MTTAAATTALLPPRQSHPEDWAPNGGVTGPQGRFLGLTCFEALYGGAAGGGKLLSLSTSIPTPAGWTTIGELRPGEFVFDETGEPTEVLAVSALEPSPDTYRIAFDDGSTLTACADHRWWTFNASELAALTRHDPAWRKQRRDGRASKAGTKKSAAFRAAIVARNQARAGNNVSAPPTGGIRTTAEIAASVRTLRGRSNHAVPVAGALAVPWTDLPVDPYVLGVWLGDGTSATGSITSADGEVVAALGATRQPSSKYGYRVPGLTSKLRALGVLRNKHVPAAYLRASRGQRLALLQGLMDTDGMACRNGSVAFSNNSRVLADAVAELACSLGHKAHVREGVARLAGRVVGPHFHVKWAAPEPVFRLQRKAARQRIAVRRTQRFRYIVSCDRVASEPMRCIQVASPRGLYLAGREMIPTHNSDCLLVDAVRYVGRGYGSKYHAILFRRTFPELEKSLIKRSWDLYPRLGGEYHEQKKLWTFPGDELVEFAHIQHENDVHNYQGAAFQFIGFDELTTFLESQYLYLFSRCRSAHGIKCRVRGATNPGGEGHEWVFKRFAPWLDPEFPQPAAAGRVSFFFKPSPTEPERVVPKGTPHAKGRTFVPARLEDNPHLFSDGEYEGALRQLDPVNYERLRHGDWLIQPAKGLYFRRAKLHFVDALPAEATWVRYWDRAATSGGGDFTVGLKIGRTRDSLLWVADVVRFQGSPGEVEATIKATAETDGKSVTVGLEQEPGASGVSEIAAYQRLLQGWSLFINKKRVNKVVAAGPFSAQWHAGNVRVLRARWNEALVQELEQFPEGAHDDQVDGCSGGFTTLMDIGHPSELADLEAFQKLMPKARFAPEAKDAWDDD